MSYKHILVAINGDPAIQYAVNVETRLDRLLRFFVNPTQAARFARLTRGRESAITVTVDGWLVAEGIWAHGRLWWHGDPLTVPESFVTGVQSTAALERLVPFVAAEHYEDATVPVVIPTPTPPRTVAPSPALVAAQDAAARRLAIAHLEQSLVGYSPAPGLPPVPPSPARRAQLLAALSALSA